MSYSPNFINDAIFSFGEAMNIVKSPTSEEEYKKWATPYDDKSITKTWSEVLTKKNSLEAEYDTQEYARTRRPKYPDIGDQLDDLYHKGAFSDEMAVKIKAIKDAHPKPE